MSQKQKEQLRDNPQFSKQTTKEFSRTIKINNRDNLFLFIMFLLQ